MRILGLVLCVCLFAGPSHAGTVQLLCTIQGATAFPERDPVTSLSIAISDRKWSVVGRGLGGTEYNRSAQYGIKDKSDPARHQIAWEGRDRKDRNQSMVGTVTAVDNGQWLYEELVYDRRKRTYFMRALCNSAQSAGAPATQEQAAAQNRAASKRRM